MFSKDLETLEKAKDKWLKVRQSKVRLFSRSIFSIFHKSDFSLVNEHLAKKAFLKNARILKYHPRRN